MRPKIIFSDWLVNELGVAPAELEPQLEFTTPEYVDLEPSLLDLRFARANRYDNEHAPYHWAEDWGFADGLTYIDYIEQHILSPMRVREKMVAQAVDATVSAAPPENLLLDATCPSHEPMHMRHICCLTDESGRKAKRDGCDAAREKTKGMHKSRRTRANYALRLELSN